MDSPFPIGVKVRSISNSPHPSSASLNGGSFFTSRMCKHEIARKQLFPTYLVLRAFRNLDVDHM
jgi:hypothetical protein